MAHHLKEKMLTKHSSHLNVFLSNEAWSGPDLYCAGGPGSRIFGGPFLSVQRYFFFFDELQLTLYMLRPCITQILFFGGVD